MPKRERWQVAGNAAEVYQRELVPAAEIARMTGINLQDEFAEVVTTAAACMPLD